jgi:hypothetical protein
LENYACYRLLFKGREGEGPKGFTQDFPCFLHRQEHEKEVLWGVTYRIVMVFLNRVFAFTPPDLDALPVVHGTLGEDYYNGT